jgi:ketosteroid isomerase-like protein
MKQFIFFIILAVAASCDDAAKQQSATVTDNSAENIAIVNQLFERFNTHDWKAMADLYIDTADVKDPSFGVSSVKQTKEQTVQKYTELNKLFPNIKDSVTAMYPSGNKHVIAEFISTGTGPDGKTFALPICSILTIENGKITKDYTYYDNSGNK